jgi:dienelactone hydrolase
VLHGNADQFIPAKDVNQFKQEMQKAGIDFEFVGYPNVKHSFTNPDADRLAVSLGLPIGYDEQADKKSWAKLQTFFQQIFAD